MNTAEDSNPDSEDTDREIEAKAIAQRILEIDGPGLWPGCMGRKTESYRKAVLGDIVVLLRTVKGWAPAFL